MFLAKKLNKGAGAPAPKDAQFNYVSMLLHGDGTNGAQNNTFLDSSTNNFTITRNGNTTQGSFSPYGSNWSFNFPTTNATFRIPASANLAFGTGNFTFETWLNSTNTTAQMAFWGSTDEADWTSDAYGIGYDPTTTSVTLEAASTLWSISTGSQISDGLWHHIAVVRNSGTWQVFIDGVSKGTTTSQGTRTLGNSTYRNALGSVEPGAGDGRFVRGYMSNCRIGNTAVYTSNFTPSTTPLTAISGTQLLTCQSNRFIDNSANNFTFTKVGSGTPSVQRFNPFGASTAYSTSVIGGSGYFDGSGDYLSLASDAAFGFGTGDFTIEFWLYVNSFTTYQTVVATRESGSPNDKFTIGYDSGGSVYLYSDTFFGQSATSAIKVGTWTHVAIVRASSSIKTYVNGTQSGSTSSNTQNFATSALGVGAAPAGTEPMNGYISNLRLVKGTAVYTANFTPPTAPLTAITNTSLLTNFTNGAIFDNAMISDLETVGTAQISTSVKKYGTGSMYVNGQGNEIICNTNKTNISFGTGDFTIECWMNTGSTSGQNMLWSFNWLTGIGGWAFYLETYLGTGLVFHDGSGQNKASWTWSTNTWYHLAVSRNGTSLRLFVDGTQLGSTFTNSTSVNALYDNVKIGSNNETYTIGFTGYIDDLRITKGYARYTANFTPPTAVLPDIGP